MTTEGHKVASLHGAKDASERDEIIDGFREGRDKVLITTNVIARGIDILQVNMVVNYELPLLNDGQPDIDTYLHRIGMYPIISHPNFSLSTYIASTHCLRRSYGTVREERSFNQFRS